MAERAASTMAMSGHGCTDPLESLPLPLLPLPLLLPLPQPPPSPPPPPPPPPPVPHNRPWRDSVGSSTTWQATSPCSADRRSTGTRLRPRGAGQSSGQTSNNSQTHTRSHHDRPVGHNFREICAYAKLCRGTVPVLSIASGPRPSNPVHRPCCCCCCCFCCCNRHFCASPPLRCQSYEPAVAAAMDPAARAAAAAAAGHLGTPQREIAGCHGCGSDQHVVTFSAP